MEKNRELIEILPASISRNELIEQVKAKGTKQEIDCTKIRYEILDGTKTIIQAASLIEGYNGKDDYGKIAGCGDKVSLFQNGAEKILIKTNLRAVFKAASTPIEKGVHYEVQCVLVDNTTNQQFGSMGLGGGFANLNDRDCNAKLQLATKRALVKAVRSSFNLLSVFTQDIEDLTTKEVKDSKLNNNAVIVKDTLIKMLNTNKPEIIKELLESIVVIGRYIFDTKNDGAIITNIEDFSNKLKTKSFRDNVEERNKVIRGILIHMINIINKKFENVDYQAIQEPSKTIKFNFNFESETENY